MPNIGSYHRFPLRTHDVLRPLPYGSGASHGGGLLSFCCALCVTVSGCSTTRTVNRQRSDSASQLAEQAFDAEERGDIHGATDLMDTAVRINPGDCEARLQLSELLLRHGNLEAASAHLETLAESNPDDPRIAFRLAQTWFLMGQVEKSESWLAIGLELDPDNEQGLLLAGKLAEWRSDSEAAMASYMRVLDVAPESNPARLRIASLLNTAGHPNRAAPHARRVLDSETACPAETAEAQWLLGESYVLIGRVPEGEHLLAMASKQRPLTPEQWHELALAQARVGRLKESLASTELALRDSPENPDARKLKAWLVTQMPDSGTVGSEDRAHQVGFWPSAVTEQPRE